MQLANSQPTDHFTRKLVGRPVFWLLLMAVLFGAPLVRGLRSGRAPAAPPPVGWFPRFSLVDDRGAPVNLDDLRGHAFIANLLCVHCTEQGPLAAETMRTLQRRTRNLGDALRLISFSNDGDAASLAAVRAKSPSSTRWLLVQGAPAEVRALFPRIQSLVLVDGQLRIRGRYGGSQQSDVDAALRDAALVLDGN
ncbi:MAG TPA: SCO family protein [Myxococcales bacterium]|nr:SCO family protein [Myxococcales bacterium]